jgi:hypothetical protein
MEDTKLSNAHKMNAGNNFTSVTSLEYDNRQMSLLRRYTPKLRRLFCLR